MALDLPRAGTSKQLEDVREEENSSKQLEVSEEDDVTYISLPNSQITVHVIALHPEKNFIAMGTECGKVLLWDLNQFKEVTEFQFSIKKVRVFGMKWNSKGTELAVGTSHDLCILHFVNKKFDTVPATVIETENSVWDSQFEWNPSGTYLVFCKYDHNGNHIYIYSEETKQTQSKRGMMGAEKIAWQNDELFTVMSSGALSSGPFHFFNTDLTEMGNVFKVEAGFITAFDWDRSGDFLAYATDENNLQCDVNDAPNYVKVWRSSTRRICPGWKNNQHNHQIQEIKWFKSANAPDGENGIVLASMSYFELKLWKKDGTCAVIHNFKKKNFGFSPSGLFFVDGNEIKTTLTNDLVKHFNGSDIFSWNLKEDLFAFEKDPATDGKGGKIGIFKLQIKTSHCDGGGAPLIVPSGSQDDANGPPSQPQLQQSRQQSIGNLEDAELGENSMKIPLMDRPAQRETPGEQNIQLY